MLHSVLLQLSGMAQGPKQRTYHSATALDKAACQNNPHDVAPDTNPRCWLEPLEPATRGCWDNGQHTHHAVMHCRKPHLVCKCTTV